MSHITPPWSVPHWVGETFVGGQLHARTPVLDRRDPKTE